MSQPLFAWKMFVKTLPFTFLFCVTKYGFYRLNWEPWAFDSLTGSLFGGTTFLLALILNETLKDYRSCENIPSEIVDALLAIRDCSFLVATQSSEYQTDRLCQSLHKITSLIPDWLRSAESGTSIFDEVLTEIDGMTSLIGEVARIGGMSIANRMQAEQSKIRTLVNKIKSNRDTNFLAETYTLLALFLGGSIIALLLNTSEEFSENITVSAFLFTSFLYLLFLIIDLDNPFRYDGKSYIDVNLKAFDDAKAILAKKD